MKAKAVVIVNGGCVSDVISNVALEWDVFDWDNMEADPIKTFEDLTGTETMELFKSQAPEAYADALEQYKHALEQRDKDIWGMEAH